MHFSFGTAAICNAGVALAVAFGAPPAQAEVFADPIGDFRRPVQATVAPGEPKLLFVVKSAGRVRVLRDGTPRAKPFLDIADIVLGPPDTGAGGEQGLLSVAFPPNYPGSGRVFVAFTNLRGAVEVDEFRRSADDPLRADPDSRRVLLAIPHPNAQNHNGGQLHFGPDRLLYISVGDGGATNGEKARNLNSLLGKILRIDPRRDGDAAYRVPADNPFVGEAGRDEIFAYGLRNPWRFSFDGKRIAIADVGQHERGEIDFLDVEDARGVNFGWPQYEGDLVFDDDRPGPHPPVFPMHVYGHDGGGCVVGGFVVRDESVPELLGRYLYGDFCTGELRSFKPNVAQQEARDDKPAGLVLPQLSAFGRGHDGEIYAVQLGGTVSRIRTAP